MGRHRGATFLSGVRRAGEWALLVVVCGMVLVAVVVPRVAGATPYAVLSGSMGPAMPAGALVVVRDVDPESIRVGDVVTFMPRENDTSVVTHRVVGVGVDMTGKPTFTTKGDANPTADRGVVHEHQLVGTRWYSVPYLGWFAEVLTAQQRAVGLHLVAGALILYALVMFTGAFRDRVRQPQADHA